MPERTTETALAKALGVSCLPNDHMKIEWWDIGKLSQPRLSPRKFSQKDIGKAKAIIQRFGLRLPLVITSDGRVIAHFLAVLASRELGYEQLPVILADDLNDTERSALSIALGRFYELGKFDQKLLGETLLDIEVQLPDLGFAGVGLDEAERDRAIAAFRGVGGAGPEVVESGPGATTLGDIWLCGRHRIGCGDTGSAEWLTRLMGMLLAAMVFADPPYNVKVDGFVTTRAHREFVEGSGELSGEQFLATASSWFARVAGCCKPGTLLYICTDWRSLPLFVEAAKSVFGGLMNLIVWAKDTAGMGSLYRSQHELIMLFKLAGAAHCNNIELGRHGRNRSNLWQYPSAQSFGKSGPEGDLLAYHPTPKNKDMIADAIRDCTKRGDIVLDPFLGSGSTLIAAETVGRVCHGCDLDPIYVDLAVRRWQNWTGRQAIHAETGRKFDDVARERVAQGGHGDA
jgi:DNA modification methylase